jgi:hypothetical protein
MGESLERLLAWRRARDRAPRTDRGAVRSADDSSDPAAALPRHADPVLGRALVLLGAGAGDGETDGGSAPGFDADLTAPLVADPVR